jgi:hypothetical protein
VRPDLHVERSRISTAPPLEPSARFERAAFSLPRRRSIHWSYEGTSWGSAILDAHLRLQRPAGCRLPIPSGAACRSRTCCLGGTGSALSPDELTRHAYPAPDSNRHYRPPQRRASCHWASWAWSLWTASNRLPSPYEGDALPDELQRHGSGSWGRTNIARFRAWNPAIERSRIKCGRCDLNAHAARSELARSAGCLHSRMVRRQGLEPRLRHRLRACRSTIELAAREPYRGVEPRWFAWRADVFPLDQYGTVGPEGIEPSCSRFSARR